MNEDQLPDADLWEKKRSEGMSPDQATAYVQGRRKPVLPGAVSSLAQGVTLGFADEITAGARALPRLAPGGESFGDAYKESVAAERRGLKGFRQAHPIAALGTELAGGVALGALGSLGAAKAGIAPVMTLGRGVGIGAASGAIGGLGAAEGGPTKRLAGAAGGAAAGATMGAIAPAIGRVGGAAMDVTRLRGPLSRLTGAVESPAERGGRAVLSAIERSGQSLDDVEYALTRSQAGNKPVTLMDAIGPEGSAQAMYVGNRPGPGRTVVQSRLRGRSTGQGKRVAEDLAEETGLGKPNAFRALDEMDAERAAAAKPLYEKLENVSVKDKDGTITEVLELPAFRRAYERAGRIAQAEGTRVPDIYDEAGKIKRGSDAPAIPVRIFDLVKRGLDDVIETGYDGSSRVGRTEARALKGRLRTMLSQVDELVPEYKEARSVYAGKSATMDAVELGAEMFKGKTDPAEIAAAMQTMSESEREFFRKGALSTLLGGLEEGRDTWDAIPRLLGSPRQRERLRALFPDQQSFDRFMGRADIEGAAERLAGPVLSGSRTEPMRLAGRDFETGAAADLAAAADQGPVRATVGALRRALFEENQGVQKVVGEAAGTAGDLLTRGAVPGSGTGRDAVAELRKLQGTLGRRAAVGSGAKATTGGMIGMGAGATLGGQAGAATQRVDESKMSDADLWEYKVSEGMDPASAAAYVKRRAGRATRP